MVNLIRKYQQTLLIAITVLVIVTFIWFWNGNQGGRGSGFADSTKVATIYGRGITDVEIKKQVRKFQLAAALGLNDLIGSFAGQAENQQQALENFVWNSYVFDHEADALQVFPTDKEVSEAYKNVTGFQTAGQFDSSKLADFVQNKLPSLGFTDNVIDDLVREQVRVNKVRELLGSTVSITPAELANHYTEENEKMNLSVVRLSLSDVEKGIIIPDGDARKQYDAHKDSYHTDEQRKVVLATFELSDAQKKLTGKERTDALQKLGNGAWTFAQAVTSGTSDFAAAAKTAGSTLQTSGLFTQAQPDPTLTKAPELANAAFKLTKDYPNSDVIEGTDGYYVLHLQDTVPAAPLAFDLAKPAIVAQIQKDRATQIMQTRANQVRDRISEALKAGKSFGDAAIGAGASAEAIPAFSLADTSKVDVPDVQPIVNAAVSLADGQISDFIPTDAGGLLVYMKNREPVDKGAMAIGQAVMEKQFGRQKQLGAFLEWMRIRRDAAKLQILQNG